MIVDLLCAAMQFPALVSGAVRPAERYAESAANREQVPSKFRILSDQASAVASLLGLSSPLADNGCDSAVGDDAVVPALFRSRAARVHEQVDQWPAGLCTEGMNYPQIALGRCLRRCL